MAQFDQRGQRVNTQINAENITVFSGDNVDNLPSQIKFLLEKEIQKYLKLDFSIIARSNTKVILVRPRKTSFGDRFKFVKFLRLLFQWVVRAVYRIETQNVQHVKTDYDLQNISKTLLEAENDWVQIEIDRLGNIKNLFEPPTLDEIERLKSISVSST